MFIKDNPVHGGGGIEGVDALREAPALTIVPKRRGLPFQAPVAAQPAQILHLRLAINDLHCGRWVSTRQGDTEQLWVVQSLTTGAGDGCMELTLAPQLL